MHYYQFNIGDWASHTAHLEPLEEIAYRRMIDWCYLHEKPLPLDIDEIARLIRMRSHNDCIAYVLQTYFNRIANGYVNDRVLAEITKYHEKSEKAKKSAKARWKNESSKNGGLDDANALRTQSESNANHKPITNNHKPIDKVTKRKRFTPPSLEEVQDHMAGKTPSPQIESENFINYYEANGWKVGRNKMSNWKAAATNWCNRAKQYSHSLQNVNGVTDKQDYL